MTACTFEITLQFLDYPSCLKLLGVSRDVRATLLTSHVGWMFAQKQKRADELQADLDESKRCLRQLSIDYEALK